VKLIDVSEHQGSIDWTKVKPNIDGAILRAGYGKGHLDLQFVLNAEACNRYSVATGAYWFSYAATPEQARDEARYLIDAVSPYRMELPLAYDFEYASAEYAQLGGTKITKSLVSDMVRSFCGEIEAAGYYVLNYANPDYLNRWLDDDVKTRYGIWLASWPAIVFSTKNPPHPCQIWQYSCKGKVDGISTKVDLNEAYLDFKSVISEAGLNHLGEKDEAEELARRIGILLDKPNEPVTRIELARALTKFKEEVT